MAARALSNRAAFVLMFAAGAVAWSLAAASGVGESPLAALPYGLAQMSVAGVMAIGIWP